MLTAAEADELAHQWIEAWNGHDLERILKHFTAALARFPTLTFRLHAVFRGIDSVTLVYESVNGLQAAETMILNQQHRVSRVLAQYDGPDLFLE